MEALSEGAPAPAERLRNGAALALGLLTAATWILCCATGAWLLLSYRPDPGWHYQDAVRIRSLAPWIVNPHRWSGAWVLVPLAAACWCARRLGRAALALAAVAGCAEVCCWTAGILAPQLPPEPEPTHAALMRAYCVHVAVAPLLLTAALAAAWLGGRRRPARPAPAEDDPLQPRSAPPGSLE